MSEGSFVQEKVLNLDIFVECTLDKNLNSCYIPPFIKEQIFVQFCEDLVVPMDSPPSMGIPNLQSTGLISEKGKYTLSVLEIFEKCLRC